MGKTLIRVEVPGQTPTTEPNNVPVAKILQGISPAASEAMIKATRSATHLQASEPVGTGWRKSSLGRRDAPAVPKRPMVERTEEEKAEMLGKAFDAAVADEEKFKAKKAKEATASSEPAVAEPDPAQPEPATEPITPPEERPVWKKPGDHYFPPQSPITDRINALKTTQEAIAAVAETEQEEPAKLDPTEEAMAELALGMHPDKKTPVSVNKPTQEMATDDRLRIISQSVRENLSRPSFLMRTKNSVVGLFKKEAISKTEKQLKSEKSPQTK
jgi:hypothetical protein